MRQHRRVGIWVVGCLCLWAATASAADAPAARKVLRFGVHVSDVGQLDPHLAAGSQDRALADMLFNGLLRYVPGDAPHLEPDLAARMPAFETVNGRQVWTVALRRGVRFHPGPRTPAHELTADDVVYSLRKAADRNRSSHAGDYADMAVEKVDPYTVRIVLQRPLSPVLFLPRLANYGGGFIVSRRALEAAGGGVFRAHPVGTGPFRFRGRTPGVKLVLDAHRDYFRGPPRLDGVEIRFAPDDERRGADLAEGRLDVIMASGQKGWLERMETIDGVAIDTHGVGEVTTLHFNTEAPPLDDVRVRRAIAYALDRRAFLDITNRRLVGGAVYSPVPAAYLPGGLAHDEAARLGLDYPPDPERARRLLAEAGHAGGFELALVSSEKRVYRRIYEVLRDRLARVGIVCRVEVVPHAEMHRRIRSQPPPIVAYVAWRPNADAFLTRFFHSETVVVSGARPDTNFARYRRIDRLIEAARQETDPRRQIRLWQQAQIRILDDMVAYPIMATTQCYLRRQAVDYGHPLVSTMALYPQFTERTAIGPSPPAAAGHSATDHR